MNPPGPEFVPARPSLRSLRRDRTRDEIARAALDLINRKGYGDTLVEEIAERALISPRTFYRYFPAKGDAFFHGLPAFERALRQFTPAVPAAGLAPQGLGPALRAAGEAFCIAIEAAGDELLSRLPHALNEPELLGQLAYRLHASEIRLARSLAPLLSPGSGQSWSAEVLAAALTASLVAALRRWQLAPTEVDLPGLVRRAVAAFEPSISALERN